MADLYGKSRRKLYYFHKESGLEIDFVTRYAGKATLVEVKSTTGNTKSSKTILKHPEKYHIERCLKFGDYNIGNSAMEGKIITFPFYIAFLVFK